MSKAISLDFARTLLKGAQPKGNASVADEKVRWPGEANLFKIAKAVERKADFVLFLNGSRFSLKYGDTSVCVKPSTGEFIPMGYFSYKQLNEVRAFKDATDA